MGGRGSSLGKGNRPPATGGSPMATPATEQGPAEPEKPVPDPEPQPSKPEPTSTPPGSTEDRIRDVVAQLAAEGQSWAGIVDIRKALPDVDHAEVTRVLQDMARNNPNVHLAPESNRKALRQEDHDAAVTYGGGEQQHLIAIQQPRDPEALHRVQAAGFANATNADLEAARLHMNTPSSTYDQIRAEQKRRAQP